MKALTAREQEVFSLVARGMPNKAIAHELGITISTVKQHIVSIMENLGVSNRVKIALTFHGIEFRERAE
jgi:DNA-binding NarL/FixJ family response regulator